MATSGVTTFNPDILELVEEAYERAGVEVRGGYDLASARRSLNLMMLDWANKGFNLWSVESSTQAVTAGTATYNLPSDTVDMVEHVIRTGSGTSQQDINLQRIGLTAWAQRSNKNTTGRPVEIFVNRGLAPSFTLWPVPDDAQTYTVAYWYLRRLEDAGSAGTNTMDMPARFIPALVAGLAYNIAMKKVGSEARVAPLKEIYEKAFMEAADEDRDRATLRTVPYIPYG